MGFFKNLFRKQKEKNLELEQQGGTITTMNTPRGVSRDLLSLKRLNNRLNIIEKHIKYLKAHNASQDRIDQWETNRKKTKALLWVYFDQT